jgi:hypothetical protein
MIRRYPMARVPELDDFAGGLHSPMDILAHGGGLAQKALGAALAFERENARRATNLRQHKESAKRAKRSESARAAGEASGRSRRMKADDRRDEVLAENEQLRRRVSGRDDARRIAERLGKRPETVRSDLRKAPKGKRPPP